MRFLTESARRGPVLFVLAILSGLVLPGVAHRLRWFIPVNVIGLTTLVLLRVDVAAALAHLRRPGRLAAVVAVHLVACPLVAWAAVSALGLDAGVAAGVVIFATGPAATSGAAFARLVGLDPELSLIATLLTTVLVPLTAPPIALALAGIDLAIGIGGFMARLALVVGVPLCLSVLIRLIAGPRRLAPLGTAIDGVVVWLVVLYGTAVTDGLPARLGADPAWVAQATVAAFAASYGLNLITAAALGWMGWRPAASAGLLSGNRNMALYLAVLPAAADPQVALFLALCQFPLFLSPFLLRPAYRWIGPAKAAGSARDPAGPGRVS